jgi:hypothetical protein
MLTSVARCRLEGFTSTGVHQPVPRVSTASQRHLRRERPGGPGSPSSPDHPRWRGPPGKEGHRDRSSTRTRRPRIEGQDSADPDRRGARREGQHPAEEGRHHRSDPRQDRRRQRCSGSGPSAEAAPAAPAAPDEPADEPKAEWELALETGGTDTTADRRPIRPTRATGTAGRSPRRIEPRGTSRGGRRASKDGPKPRRSNGAESNGAGTRPDEAKQDDTTPDEAKQAGQGEPRQDQRNQRNQPGQSTQPAAQQPAGRPG